MLPMLKIYIACSYKQIERARKFRTAIERIPGCYVISRWLNGPSDRPLDSLSAQEIEHVSRTDLEDVNRADIVVVLAEGKPQTSGGGRHVEFGYALASGIPIYWIGPVEHPFVAAGGVTRLSSEACFLDTLEYER
jgi:hypothetical protein